MSSATLKKKAVNGAVWTIVGYGFSQSLRLGSNLVLTRLLVPDLFGLMALVNVFITGLALFSDVGINPSIIRSKRGDDPVFLNTAWTIQVVRGFGLWLGCTIIAFPVSRFYEEPRLLWLIPIVGFNTILDGFNSTSIASLSRHMEISKLTLFELTGQIISVVAIVTWAWFSPTIWALVGGTAINSCCKLWLSHRLNPGQPNRLTWNKEVVREIASFGKWIFLSTAVSFLATQADRLICGKLFSLSMLGVYTVAFNFASLPKQVVQKIGDKIIFPVIAQSAELPRQQLRAKIIKKRWIVLIAQGVLLTIMVSFGDLLIVHLYDERFIDAAWILPLLSLGLWPLMLSLTSDKALFVLGNPSYVAYGNIFKFIYMLIGLPYGFSQMGVFGAVIVIAFNDIPFYAAVSYGLWREKLSTIAQDILSTLMLLGAIAVVEGGRYYLGWGLSISGIL